MKMKWRSKPVQAKMWVREKVVWYFNYHLISHTDSETDDYDEDKGEGEDDVEPDEWEELMKQAKDVADRLATPADAPLWAVRVYVNLLVSFCTIYLANKWKAKPRRGNHLNYT
jgi:hypothetical protein